MYGTYEQFQDTYAKTLQSNVKVNNLKARLRKYDSARHASLAANFIPESVYDTLVAAVNKHLPLLHRYINLRKKLLGIDDLKMYDMYTPLSDFSTKISYEDALKKCQETLEIFGEEYSAIVKKPSKTAGLTSMLMKENAQEHTQEVLTTPTPSCFSTGRITWITCTLLSMKQATLSILC